MAKNFSYPSTRKITLGARLKIMVLPFNVRTPTTYTFTTTRSFNSNTNPGIIYLKANTAKYLSIETKLSFSGTIIEIAEDVLIDTTETPVSIIDMPANTTIANNSISLSRALLLINGCKNFNITPEIQTIDTTNVSHGLEKEEKQSFISRKLNFDVIEIYGDLGNNLLMEMCENLSYRNIEFWFNYSYADGSFKEGAALITNVSYTSNMQSLRSYRIEARIQPGTYNYLNN